MKINYKLWVMLLGLFGIACVMQSYFLLNWDNRWLLVMTQRWLAGGTYTQDFFDPDPPMIMLVLSIPLMMAKWFGWSVVFSFLSFTFALSCLSLSLAYYFLMRLFIHDDGLTILMTLSLAIVYWIVPLNAFGQRDHLILLLFMPYCLALLTRLNGRQTLALPSAVLVGVLAGIGVSIKPFYGLMILVVETYHGLVIRSYKSFIRVETLSVALTFSCYMLIVYHFFMDYFSLVVPYALRLYPGGMAQPLLVMLFSPPILYCTALLGLSCCIPASENDKKILRFLSLLLMTSLIVYVYQRNAFFYHLVPVLSLAILLAIYCAILLLAKMEKNRLDVVPKLATVVIFSGLLSYAVPGLWTVVIFEPAEFYGYCGLTCVVAMIGMRLSVLRKGLITFVIVAMMVVLYQLALFSGFSTHLFIESIVVLIILFALLTPADSCFSRCGNGLTVFFAVVLFAYPVYFISTVWQKVVNDDVNVYRPLSYLYQRYQAQGPVTVFTAQLNTIAPAMNFRDASYATRLPFLWMLPTFVNRPVATEQRRRDVNFLIMMVTEDLNRYKPATVFVDTKINKGHLSVPFEYLPFFLQNEKFRAAWAPYRYEKSFSLADSYVSNKAAVQFAIYRRVGDRT